MAPLLSLTSCCPSQAPAQASPALAASQRRGAAQLAGRTLLLLQWASLLSQHCWSLPAFYAPVECDFAMPALTPPQLRL